MNDFGDIRDVFEGSPGVARANKRLEKRVRSLLHSPGYIPNVPDVLRKAVALEEVPKLRILRYRNDEDPAGLAGFEVQTLADDRADPARRYLTAVLFAVALAEGGSDLLDRELAPALR